MPKAEEIIDTFDTFEADDIMKLISDFKTHANSNGFKILNKPNSVGSATQEIMELLHEHIDFPYYMSNFYSSSSRR